MFVGMLLDLKKYFIIQRRVLKINTDKKYSNTYNHYPVMEFFYYYYCRSLSDLLFANNAITTLQGKG